ncbi:MAG: copper resistance protein CopC [Gemmatimonadetes bacterium]|nr:copper resistance protein CopC [Gemmatimonadota bacterium]
MGRSIGIPSALALVALVLFAARSDSSEPALHVALVRSAPAADSIVESPREVRLWLTEAPQAGTTSIRLLNSAGTLVPTDPAAPSPNDATVFSSAVTTPLASGRYTVAWRAMAADGHVETAQFNFTVRSTE